MSTSSAVPGTEEPSSEGEGRLSLRALHATLEARGVSIGYSTLSELVNTGDVGEQLGVSGGGNKRAFPAAAVDAAKKRAKYSPTNDLRKTAPPFIQVEAEKTNRPARNEVFRARKQCRPFKAGVVGSKPTRPIKI